MPRATGRTRLRCAVLIPCRTHPFDPTIHIVVYNTRCSATRTKGYGVADEPVPDVVRMNPRTRRVRQAVLAAAVEVLLSEGPKYVTAVRVADQADVARTTIYRHWPDQASLLLATIDALTSPHHPTPELEVFDRDLRSALHNLRTRLVVRETRAVFGALASHAHQDEAFAAAQRRFVEQLIQPVADLLEAAREQGEVGSEMDALLEATLLAGPLLNRHLMLQADIPDDLIEAVAARWLAFHNLG